MRRYEILLPLSFNDGRSVPEELIGQTVQELRDRFGAVSCETQVIRGYWAHEGFVMKDDLVRIFVDVPDLPEHREFFLGLKQRLKARFEQLEIWLISHAIEAL